MAGNAQRTKTFRLLKALQQYTRPYGVLPLSFYSAHKGYRVPPGADGKARFEALYNNNDWGSSESVSGEGSEFAFTSVYRPELISFLEQSGVASLFDAPCGDLNWMQHVLADIPLSYEGGDIVSKLVARNKETFPNYSFRVFDITADPFPDADIWHCRDCLFHLSYKDIWRALANFANSNIPAALITTHKTRLHKNRDIETGGWRFLDLTKAPFNFPQPKTMLPDYHKGTDCPRYMALWSREEIAAVVACQ